MSPSSNLVVLEGGFLGSVHLPHHEWSRGSVN